MRVGQALHFFVLRNISKDSVAQDAISAEVAYEEYWIEDLNKGIVAHTGLSKANPGNQWLWVCLQLLVVHDGSRDENKPSY